MQKNQQGFTLIELMIVVAIIGILAAIAIPAYQDYIARSQATEAVNILGGARTAIEEYASQNGAFPDNATAGQTLADLGVARTSGDYVASLTIFQGAGGAGCLIATMQANGVSTDLASDVITMHRDATGDWTPGAAGTTADQKFLPQAFRGNTGVGACA
ncbi:MAG: pilin [Abyssibacter sp.]|uniref:pilin n=1 Tax=Abyssibacter sp. TaxID=2320200 RepID=UPI00321A1F9D